MREINGFQIDAFNRYKLPENSNKSTCPLCSEHRKPANQKAKCLKIDWERGLAHCFHCGETIQLHTYHGKKKDSTRERKTYSRPTYVNNTSLDNSIVEYFQSRGISQFTLRLAKVSQCIINMPPEWNPRKVICFNYFREGEIINIKYRTRDKKFMMFKGAELVMYNLDNCKVSNDVILCEGEMDALAYMEAGMFNVLSVPNGSTLNTVNLEYIDNCIEYFENKEKIYLSLDNDEAGQNVTKELIRRFGSNRCFLVDLRDCKDANEHLIKHGAESLREAVRNANEVPIEGVSSVLDWEDDFKEYLINGMKRGYTIGIESFDRIFSTYTGQYIVVTGIPSSGKSDFVDQMCIGYNRNYGWKIAIASPENKPNKIHAGKIMSKICGQWVNRAEYLIEGWFKAAMEKINNTFKYIDLDTYDLDVVLEKTKELIFKYGIKVLVIDPFNKIRLKRSLNKNINEYTNDYLIAIDEFARKHDILVILVAHPTKPGRDGTVVYEPDFYSIKGGGEFYDMSPHGLLVHRDYANDVVKVKVLKVKFSHLGENNKHVYLSWNKQNGRYTDFRTQSDKPEGLKEPLYDSANWVVEAEKKRETGQLEYKENYQTERSPSGLPEFMRERNDLPF